MCEVMVTDKRTGQVRQCRCKTKRGAAYCASHLRQIQEQGARGFTDVIGVVHLEGRKPSRQTFREKSLEETLDALGVVDVGESIVVARKRK